MYRKDANGGFKCGVLNDWDLSKVDDKAKESWSRTGTRAFLARDLLESIQTAFFERHEMESFFYVLVWNAARYENGEEVNTHYFTKWAADDESNRNSKAAYITDIKSRPVPKGMFARLYFHWIWRLADVFFQGIIAMNSNALDVGLGKATTFDEETLGGRVTYENLWAILKEDLPKDCTSTNTTVI